MAALLIGRKRKNREWTRLGQLIMKEFKKLDKIGSVNSRPVYLCLHAVEVHQQVAYEKAIAACNTAKLIHLEAIMCELCGRMVREDGKPEISNMYLARAMWLFYDWGAFAKVKQMTIRFRFLLECPREDGNLSTTTGSVVGGGGGGGVFGKQEGNDDHDSCTNDDYDYTNNDEVASGGGTSMDEPKVPQMDNLRSSLKK